MRIKKLILAMIMSTGFLHSGLAFAAEQDLVEYLTSNPQYSTLVRILTRLNLVDTLAKTEFATVFAPTDEAFKRAHDKIGFLSDAEIQAVILSHVLPERKYPTSLLLSFTLQGSRNATQDSGYTLTNSLGGVIGLGLTRFSANGSKVCVAQVLSQAAQTSSITIGNNRYGRACISTNYDIVLKNNIVLHEIDDVIVSTGEDFTAGNRH